MALITSYAEARRYLERMLQWQTAPQLTVSEVEDLVALARVPDSLGYAPDALPSWQIVHVFPVNAIITPLVRNGVSYRATVGGVTAAAEPLWPESGDVVDGGVTWTAYGVTQWTPSYNLPLAAAEGWEWKAAKAVAGYDVKAGSVDAKRNQIYKACLERAKHFRSMAGPSGSSIGVITLGTYG
jgi:hypothetical protein